MPNPDLRAEKEISVRERANDLTARVADSLRHGCQLSRSFGTLPRAL